MSKRRTKLKDDEPIVIVKPIAYYKMLIHILRFGNKVRDFGQYKEVMGMLIGHLEGVGEVKNVIVEDAVPISHGGSIDVEFSGQDYGTFAIVDENAFAQGKHAVGWYHSHPALRIFWSSTDIKNQLFWQTENNPSGIGIVFDHVYLENPEDLGFRTFRLTDFRKGMKSDYHEVKTIVEPPESLEYYFKLMELINCIHAKEPPILEISETPDIFGEIYFPDKTQLLLKKPQIQFNELFSSLHKGITELLRFSVEPIINYLNSWSQDIIKNFMNNNIKIRDNLEELKNNLTQGISKIQNDFKFLLMNQLNDLSAYINDKFEQYDQINENINNQIQLLKEDVNKNLINLFENKINVSTNEKVNFFENLTNKLAEIIQKDEKSFEDLEKEVKIIESIDDKINLIDSRAINRFNTFESKKVKIIKDNTENLRNALSEFKNECSNFSSNFELFTQQVDNIKKTQNNKIEKGGV